MLAGVELDVLDEVPDEDVPDDEPPDDEPPDDEDEPDVELLEVPSLDEDFDGDVEAVEDFLASRESVR